MRIPGLVTLVIVILGSAATAADHPSSASLPRSTPEAQGVSSSGIQAFVEAADREIDSLHSFMMVRHGHVVAEGWWTPYSAGTPHELYSLSKSFTSTAVGLAIAEGKLSVDDEVLKFFPEDAPESPSKNLRSMRISDLLRMSTGQQVEPTRPPDAVWTKRFLAQPVPFKPGTHFLYNTSATYMLSAIVQKVTGQKVIDYLRPRLFEPLGIENPTWGESPQGINLGGYGLSVRTEDIAKFGLLYLRKGKWGDRQLVPTNWVEAATARQTSNGSAPNSDWDQGYGYQFWRSRHGAYRGDGAFGQYCIVMPDQDAVIAITSGVRNMQAVLDLVWNKLLPAMKSESFPPDDAARAKLQSTLAGLTIRPQQGTGSPADVLGKTYKLPTNPLKFESIRLDGAKPVQLAMKVDGQEHRIACEPGTWSRGQFTIASMFHGAAAGSGAWVGENTFKARVCYYETPYLVTFSLKFEGDSVHLDAEMNVGFGRIQMPKLVGKAE